MGLLRAAIIVILLAIAVGWVANRLPWQVVESPDRPTLIVPSARPPDSLIRSTRDGIVGPRDFFKIWRQSVSSPSVPDEAR